MVHYSKTLFDPPLYNVLSAISSCQRIVSWSTTRRQHIFKKPSLLRAHRRQRPEIETVKCCVHAKRCCGALLTARYVFIEHVWGGEATHQPLPRGSEAISHRQRMRDSWDVCLRNGTSHHRFSVSYHHSRRDVVCS